MNLKDNKKIIFIALGFIVFILLISVIYLSFSNNTNDYNNPGGSGGDYTPKNKVFLTNSGILYKYLLDSDVEVTMELIKDAVLYNKTVSNNKDSTVGYKNFTEILNEKIDLYKTDQSYEATIENNEINFDETTVRDYWLTIKTDDGRLFKIQSHGSASESDAGAMVIVTLVE